MAIHDPAYQEVDSLAVRHGDALLKFLRSKGATEDDALDVAQETYLRLWRRRDCRRSGTRERSLLFKIAQNVFVDRIRRRRTRERTRQQVVLHRHLAHILEPVRPITALAAKQDLARVRRALNAMPSDQLQVFVLRRFQGKSYGEIARALNVCERTVERRMQRALENLGAELDPMKDDR